MEFVGEEKKIQELYRELRLENERVTPRFASMWARAQAAPARPLRAFNLSFALATALVVVALVTLALWTRHSHVIQPPIATFNPTSPAGPAPSTPEKPKDEQAIAVKTPDIQVKKPRPVKHSIHQEAATELALNKTEINEAKAISSWESPTASLLRSPSEQVLTTVPQFNDAVKDMKSFLPGSDKPKEK